MRWRVWISVAAQYTFLGPTTAPSDPLSSAVEEMAASFYDQQAASWARLGEPPESIVIAVSTALRSCL